MKRRDRNGQVLILFALFLIVLLGFGALAIDIGSYWAANRHYRAVADAASLAGGQDLQVDGSRLVSSTEYGWARGDAMKAVLSQLSPLEAPPSCPGVSGPGVSGTRPTYSGDVIDCPIAGGTYRVSIKSPSPNCVDCIPSYAVQVTVREPAHGVSFARVFGVQSWNVQTTSVAGLRFSKAYALITLRPQRPIGSKLSDANSNDVNLAGTNTIVNITSGDVGTNTYVETNASSRVNLDPGYFIYHIDTNTPDAWNEGIGTPPGAQLTATITEPTGYSYPDALKFPASQTYLGQTNGVDPAGCTSATSGITFTYQTGADVSKMNMVCYRPGIYQSDFNVPTKTDVAYLEPGVYIFRGNVNVNGYLFGGLQTSAGVTLVVDKANNFDGGSADGIVLNTGPATCMQLSCRATPAVLVETTVQSPDGLPLTIMITTDNTCFVSGTSPRLPQLCGDTSAANTGTNQLQLGASSGAGALIKIGGVIWAPTDNVKISSNYTNQQSFVGRIITWTVKYNGGAALNEEGPANSSEGILRIDAACSPSEACVSP